MSPFDSTSNGNPLQVLHLKDGTTTTVDKVYRYFAGLFAAEESGEEFPVNLDHVWKLAYARKEECKRALDNMGFREKLDFKVSRRNAENPKGGRPSAIYMLSIQVVEHLIARKVDEIFEIYRQCRIEVTRRAKEAAAVPKVSNLMLAKLMLAQLEEQETRLAQVERDVEEIRAEQNGATGFRTLLGYCIMKDLHFGKVKLSVWGRKLSAHCRQNKIVFHQVDSENFDKIGSYPIGVIEETFDALGPKPEEE